MKISSGLDFGTTNSVIGYNDGVNVKLINLSEGKYETRTVLFEDTEENEFIVGDLGIQRFIKGSIGRLLQSPKSFLNSREEIKTFLMGKQYTLTEIVCIIIRDFKKKLENTLDKEVDNVLLGRPVNFHDKDKDLDKLAQDRLQAAAKLAGFKHIEFQLEPIAAAKTYQSTLHNQSEENVIIADLGGGTSDFSFVNITNNNMKVIGNTGVYVGGNNFDRKLSYNFFCDYIGKGSIYSSFGSDCEIPPTFFQTLSDWKKLHELSSLQNKSRIREYFNMSKDKVKIGRLLEISEDPLLGYEYYSKVEGVKKQLSKYDICEGNFDIFKEKFNFDISRLDFEEIINIEINQIINTIKELLLQSGLSLKDIDKIFLTGGSSFLPIIQREIEILLGEGKIVNNERFSSIGYGLTLESHDRFE